MPPWLMNLSLIVMSTALGLAVSEAYLRVSDFSYPSFYVADKVIGHGLRPGAEGWFREEGEAYIKVNQYGWRDHAHKKEKQNGTKRIAILGDSYAEALQVPQENTFWAILEKELNACHAFGSMKAEVMNFGVSGYGTGQELLVLQDHVWHYAPDIVVLAFTAGNDVRDNSKVLSQSLPRPYFVNMRESLVLDNSFIESRNYRLKQSRIWLLIQDVSDYFKIIQFLNLAVNRLTRKNTTEQNEGPEGLEPGLDDNVYREPNEEEWVEAWRVTEELILKIREDIVVRGAQFLLVTLSAGIQVNPDSVARESFESKLQVTDLFYPERRLQNLARRGNFEILTLAPALLDYAEKHRTFLHGFANSSSGRGHWNEEGHRVAGHSIAKYFCSHSQSVK